MPVDSLISESYAVNDIFFFFAYDYMHIKTPYICLSRCVRYAVTEDITVMCLTVNVNSLTVATLAYFLPYEIFSSVFNGPFRSET